MKMIKDILKNKMNIFYITNFYNIYIYKYIIIKDYKNE